MAAPDKIYLQELSDGTWDDCFVYESSETDTNGKKRVPYIRKDALMEFLEKAIQLLSDGSLGSYYISLAYKDMIQYLNDM